MLLSTVDHRTDDQLIATVATALAVPKQAPASSFVLHAPLELLARARLLPLVRPSARDAARGRIAELSEQYAADGDPVDGAPPRGRASDPADGLRRLRAAMAAGDLEATDAAVRSLDGRATPSVLRRGLAPAVVPSLAAAGHAPILLALLPRVPAVRHAAAGLLRGTARELARHPDWQLTWFEDRTIVGPGRSLTAALLAVPSLGTPRPAFIRPIMGQAEASGLAAARLSGPVAGAQDSPAAAARELARIASWSMLQDTPDHAPYGWTHALTMPQAALALAGHGVDERTAVAVAATHVLGFRAALGAVALQPVPPARPGPPVADVATRAAVHPDAHVVKYVLACLDAAAADPAWAALHLHAADALLGWWDAHPEGQDLG